jgi:hypothetical protein
MKLAVAAVAVAVVAVALGVTGVAHARAQTELPYGVAEAFSTAVRFVRIDKGCKVVDKDGEAAYVAFECSDEGRVKRGALELIKLGTGVRAQLILSDDTHGMELRWLELYERKLRDERGTPVPTPPKPSVPPPAKDAGV